MFTLTRDVFLENTCYRRSKRRVWNYIWPDSSTCFGTL